MGKDPRRGRLKPSSSSQAAEPEGPDCDAPLPVPEAGPAGPGVRGADGSFVHGLPGRAERNSALLITAEDEVPVAAGRCTEVLRGLREASCETRSAVAVVAAAVASLVAETSPKIVISSKRRSVNVMGKDGPLAATKSTTGCRTGSRTGRASVSGGVMVATRQSTVASDTAATGTATAVTVPAGTTLFTPGISCSAVVA